MIAQAFVTHWRSHAPWSSDAQIEQDLVLSRAIVEIFSDPDLTLESFRKYLELGGTPFTRPLFEANLREKLDDPVFTSDVLPLLTEEARTRYLSVAPSEVVLQRLIALF